MHFEQKYIQKYKYFCLICLLCMSKICIMEIGKLLYIKYINAQDKVRLVMKLKKIITILLLAMVSFSGFLFGCGGNFF